MPNLLGHVGIALLLALPAWYVWEDRLPVAFVAFALAAAMLPDVDLVLARLLPDVHHHGVTHTVLFVVLVSVSVGLAATPLLGPTLQRWERAADERSISDGAVRRLIVGGLVFGGLSHLVADVLSAPDVGQPIEPFWPLSATPFAVDVLYYSAFWVNLGLAVAGVALHVVLASYLGRLRPDAGRE